jgi:hypothetical protein
LDREVEVVPIFTVTTLRREFVALHTVPTLPSGIALSIIKPKYCSLYKSVDVRSLPSKLTAAVKTWRSQEALNDSQVNVTFVLCDEVGTKPPTARVLLSN